MGTEQFEITCKGEIAASLLSAFDVASASVGGGVTCLRVPDREPGRLLGLIAGLRAAGLELLDVRARTFPSLA